MEPSGPRALIRIFKDIPVQSNLIAALTNRVLVLVHEDAAHEVEVRKQAAAEAKFLGLSEELSEAEGLLGEMEAPSQKSTTMVAVSAAGDTEVAVGEDDAARAYRRQHKRVAALRLRRAAALDGALAFGGVGSQRQRMDCWGGLRERVRTTSDIRNHDGGSWNDRDTVLVDPKEAGCTAWLEIQRDVLKRLGMDGSTPTPDGDDPG